MVESEAIASSPKYQEFESKHNRHLNMLAENVSVEEKWTQLSHFRALLGSEFAQIGACWV